MHAKMPASKGEISRESDSTETEGLLRNGRSFRPRQNKRHLCRFSYRLIKIPEKGAMLMIFYNMFFATTLLLWDEKAMKYHYTSMESLIVVWIPGCISLLLCPSTGLVSEICLGRYRFLTASLYLWLITIVLMALDIIISSGTVYFLHLATAALSLACYVSCAIPFTIDQLVGASGEELSFTIYWIVWAWSTFSSVADTIHSHLPESYQLRQAVGLSVCSMSFISAYVMTQCCCHVLMTKPQLSNPVKLIIRVLNYARKHKFPERRSAFTYWEDECPSRIDLGKDKYGGPFTVEKVENVKTVFKLTPLIVCITGSLFLDGTPMHYHFRSCRSENARFYYSLVRNVLVISWLPIYQFLIYPFFYNRVPSMLRRIGIGMFVIVSSQLFEFLIYFALTDNDVLNVKNGTFVRSESEVPPVGEWLILSSYLVRDVSLFIVCSITLEFCMAQAPCQVRGLVSTVILSVCGIFWVLQLFLHHLILIAWVFYIVCCATALVFFVMFLFASKWYKLRKRDDVIPYYTFAEDQFESNYRQESIWLRNHGYFDSSASTNESQSTAK